jgi:two-component system repressor protein LuxO
MLIADSLLSLYSKEEGKSFQGFDKRAQDYLLSYAWLGNVRELQNAIRQIVVLNSVEWVTAEMFPGGLSAIETSADASDNTLPARSMDAADLPASAPEIGGDTVVEILPLWKIEENHIALVLRHCDDNVPRAAALLEVSPSTLYRKLKNEQVSS